MKRKNAKKISRPDQWEGKVAYFSDYVQPKGTRQPLVVWACSQGNVPRWLDRLSNWVEVLATGVMSLCGLYWIWYCMCCV